MPSCTRDSWIEDWLKSQGREDEEIELCTVGKGGLDIGSGPHGRYFYDEETNPEPDERVFICRDDQGNCGVCVHAIS